MVREIWVVSGRSNSSHFGVKDDMMSDVYFEDVAVLSAYDTYEKAYEDFVTKIKKYYNYLKSCDMYGDNVESDAINPEIAFFATTEEDLFRDFQMDIDYDEKIEDIQWHYEETEQGAQWRAFRMTLIDPKPIMPAYFLTRTEIH